MRTSADGRENSRRRLQETRGGGHFQRKVSYHFSELLEGTSFRPWHWGADQDNKQAESPGWGCQMGAWGHKRQFSSSTLGWRTKATRRRKITPFSAKQGDRYNLQTQNTPKDCQKQLWSPRSPKGWSAAEVTCGDLRTKTDSREPSLTEQRAASASKNTFPEGTGESDEETGASKTQKTSTRKTKASQKGSRVENAAPGSRPHG